MDRHTVLSVFGFQRGYLSALVDDIPDERLTEQPGGFANHPAWQIGHLAFAADGIAEMLGGGPKALDQAWTDKYGMGSTPVGDRGAYPTKGDLLATLDKARARLASAWAEASEVFLAKTNPLDPLVKGGVKTNREAGVFFMVFHEGTHLGQLAAWRKLAGMGEALAKLR